MSVPAGRDVTVFLASDNPAAVKVPPSVVIPAGADRAVFDIRITDDTVIDDGGNGRCDGPGDRLDRRIGGPRRQG